MTQCTEKQGEHDQMDTLVCEAANVLPMDPLKTECLTRAWVSFNLLSHIASLITFHSDASLEKSMIFFNVHYSHYTFSLFISVN